MHWDRGAIALYTVALLGGLAGLYHDGFLFGCGAALLAASVVNCIYQPEEAITGCGALLLWLLFLPLLDWGAAAIYLGGGLGGALLARGKLARHSSSSALVGCFYGTLIGAGLRVTTSVMGRVLPWSIQGAVPAAAVGLLWLLYFVLRFGRASKTHERIPALILVLATVPLGALTGEWVESLPGGELAYGTIPLIIFHTADEQAGHLPLLLSCLSGMFAGALLGCLSAKLMPRFLQEFKSREAAP